MLPKKILLLTCLSFISAFYAFSQSNSQFKEGYILKETSYEYGYLALSETPGISCYFKKNKDEKAVTYTTVDIEGYGFLNATQYNKRSVKKHGTVDSEELFLEAVVPGVVSFYRYQERMFVERGESFYEIRYLMGLEDNYRSILISLVSDCDFAKRKARHVRITSSAVKELVEMYNKCFLNDGKEKRPGGTIRQVDAFVGYDRTYLTFEDTKIISLNGNPFTDRTHTWSGVNFGIKPLRLKHFAFKSGIWYNQQKLYMVSQENSSTEKVLRIIGANYSVLKIPILLQVDNLIATKVQPYMRVGIALPVMLKKEITLTEERESTSSVYYDDFIVGKKMSDGVSVNLMGGVYFPLSSRLNIFAEAFITNGSASLQLLAPILTDGKTHLTSYGANLGLTYHVYAK